MVNGRQTRIFLDTIDATVIPAIKESEALKSDSKYEALLLNLQMDLNQYFVNAKVHLYGSRVIGLATKESDLDIFIETGDY
jgi:DNA polymerase sigma